MTSPKLTVVPVTSSIWNWSALLSTQKSSKTSKLFVKDRSIVISRSQCQVVWSKCEAIKEFWSQVKTHAIAKGSDFIWIRMDYWYIRWRQWIKNVKLQVPDITMRGSASSLRTPLTTTLRWPSLSASPAPPVMWRRRRVLRMCSRRSGQLILPKHSLQVPLHPGHPHKVTISCSTAPSCSTLKRLTAAVRVRRIASQTGPVPPSQTPRTSLRLTRSCLEVQKSTSSFLTFFNS